MIEKKDKANFFKLKNRSIILGASQVLGNLTNIHPGAAMTPSTWLTPLFFLAPYQFFTYPQFVIVSSPLRKHALPHVTLSTPNSELRNDPYLDPLHTAKEESNSPETGIY